MTVHFRCARCNQRLRAVDRLVGRPVRCPRCQSRLRVPAPAPDEPAVEPIAPPAAMQPTRPTADRIVLDSDDLQEPGERGTRGRLSVSRADLGLGPGPEGPALSDGLAHLGKTCPFCQSPIAAEDRVAACTLCGIPHHQECWRENGGCTTFGCEAAPMPAAARGAAGVPRVCPYCGGLVHPATGRCVFCGVTLSPSGRVATHRAGAGADADKALALAFVSILVPLLVPVAIWLGGRVLQRAEAGAETEGVSTARVALVLATAAGVLWIAILFALLSAL